jgi:hypothetical protein
LNSVALVVRVRQESHPAKVLRKRNRKGSALHTIEEEKKPEHQRIW